MKVTVILPAAGLGTRMGRAAPEKDGTSRKQFMLLDGSPILLYTIGKFVSSPWVSEIVVALRADDINWVGELLSTTPQFWSPNEEPLEGAPLPLPVVFRCQAALALTLWRLPTPAAPLCKR
jgi:2-C-methyl-D-erythritol 4-phosphate cytidylyltransferase